jgi:putative nucleotidyltransferase with HDIG domain
MNRHLPLWRRLDWRLGFFFAAVTLLAIGVTGIVIYERQKREVETTLGSQLLNIARTGALLIDPALHAEAERALRQDSEAYLRIRKALAAIQREVVLPTPIYTLTDFDPDKRQARFMVTSGGPGFPGEPYPLVGELIEPLRHTFADGVARFTRVYRNQSGAWITAFAPIADDTGRTIAVLDVDYPIDVYLDRLHDLRRTVVGASLAGALGALVLGMLFARRLTRGITQLTVLARGIVEGNLSSRARIEARDEIGMLGNVLHLMVERLEVSHRSMIDVLVRALEARQEAPGSLRRLATASLALAERLELSPVQREAIEMGALLHDIGEIRIPETVLQAAGSWTPAERQIAAKHPAWGVEILERVPLLTPALEVVEAHHERWDGGGYPQGLRGEEIPVTARIFAVVDALDAMTHERPHRPARGLDEALGIIRGEAGTQFDPHAVEAALRIPAPEWAERLGLMVRPEPSLAATTG